MRTRSILILAGTTAVFALTACTPAPTPTVAPTPSTSEMDTPTASPSPTVDPVVDRIELGNAGLTLFAGDRELAIAPDTDMTVALTVLTEALGAPVTAPGSGSSEQYCAIVPDIHTWSDSLWIADKRVADDRYLDIRLLGGSVTRADGSVVVLSTASGVSVGVDGPTLRASVPTADVYALQYTEPQAYRVILAEDEDAEIPDVGVVAFISGEVVTAIFNHESLTALDRC